MFNLKPPRHISTLPKTHRTVFVCFRSASVVPQTADGEKCQILPPGRAGGRCVRNSRQLLSQMRASLPLSAERVMASNVRTLASISAMLTG